ncbi:hypothetical protein [Microbacterium sp. YY-01]|uniref:hypothetical protein n=1 Tax=Microbacterium sp. YY-01 TaxID=3421634 RepID=UPI003D174D46
MTNVIAPIAHTVRVEDLAEFGSVHDAPKLAVGDLVPLSTITGRTSPRTVRELLAGDVVHLSAIVDANLPRKFGYRQVKLMNGYCGPVHMSVTPHRSAEDIAAYYRRNIEPRVLPTYATMPDRVLLCMCEELADSDDRHGRTAYMWSVSELKARAGVALLIESERERYVFEEYVASLCGLTVYEQIDWAKVPDSAFDSYVTENAIAAKLARERMSAGK